MITPNTNIKLLKVPFELDNLNQLTFTSLQNQETYFNSLPSIDLENATFQRKDNRIRFETNEEFTYDDVLEYNFCMYQNTSYGTKWFYAFITNVEYKNDGMSELEIKTDVFQTYQFDMIWNSSFIEREHVSKANDTASGNLVPENLETGEYTIDSSLSQNELQDVCPVIAMNYDPIVDHDQGFYSGNVYQAYGCYVVGVTLQTMFSEQSQITAISGLMEYLASKGKSDSVLSIFMAPKKLADWRVDATWTVINLHYVIKQAAYNNFYTQPYNFTDMSIQKPTSLNGYTPKNKKLFTYPYCYLLLNNNSGQTAVYRYEDFSTSNIKFGIKGVLSIGCSIRAVPKNYKGITNNYEYGLNLGKYATCSWNNDVYINWLTQNAINVPMDIASGTISTASGVITGNPIGIAAGGISIANSLSSIYSHSLNPVQTSGNINSGDINMGDGKNTFTLEAMTIKSSFARIIDDYFTMYGYATHRVKIPNLNNRSNWNYVKTIGANITGDIPQKDLQELKDIFNNGVTLWHNPSTFLDYSQNNN